MEKTTYFGFISFFYSVGIPFSEVFLSPDSQVTVREARIEALVRRGLARPLVEMALISS